MLININIIWAR